MPESMHEAHRTFPVILGMALSDAIPLIKASKFVFRIHKADDRTNNIGNTLIPFRVNLNLEKGIVVGYTFY